MTIQNKMTEIFDKYGVFFAFSNKQLSEQSIEGVEYVGMGGGMVAPKNNAKAVNDELNAAIAQNIKDDLKENGKKKIIWRELANYETQIGGDIDPTVDALESYGITRDEIEKEYRAYFQHCIKHDLF